METNAASIKILSVEYSTVIYCTLNYSASFPNSGSENIDFTSDPFTASNSCCLMQQMLLMVLKSALISVKCNGVFAL